VGITDIIIVGIGKHTSVSSDIYADSNLPYVNETSTSNIRNELAVEERDVLIFDDESNFVETINTNDSFDQSAFQNAINNLID